MLFLIIFKIDFGSILGALPPKTCAASERKAQPLASPWPPASLARPSLSLGTLFGRLLRSARPSLSFLPLLLCSAMLCVAFAFASLCVALPCSSLFCCCFCFAVLCSALLSFSFVFALLYSALLCFGFAFALLCLALLCFGFALLCSALRLLCFILLCSLMFAVFVASVFSFAFCSCFSVFSAFCLHSPM